MELLEYTRDVEVLQEDTVFERNWLSNTDCIFFNHLSARLTFRRTSDGVINVEVIGGTSLLLYISIVTVFSFVSTNKNI